MVFEYTLEQNGWCFMSLWSVNFEKIRKKWPIPHLCVRLWYYLHPDLIKMASWLSPVHLCATHLKFMLHTEIALLYTPLYWQVRGLVSSCRTKLYQAIWYLGISFVWCVKRELRVILAKHQTSLEIDPHRIRWYFVYW